MATSLRTYEQALNYARQQHEHETYDWTGYCQKFVRSCYAIPPMFGSAWAQWLGADAEDRHAGGSPGSAPLGSALCYKGSGPYGHIMLAARATAANTAGAWSNDLKRLGDIDHVARTAPNTKWNQKYLGYLTAVNDYDLQLRIAAPPKPKHTQRYEGIKKAIDNLENALERAVKDGDKRDARVIRTELRDLRELYDDIRHA